MIIMGDTCRLGEFKSERTGKCVSTKWDDFRSCQEEKQQGACPGGYDPDPSGWVKEHCSRTCCEFADFNEFRNRPEDCSRTYREYRSVCDHERDEKLNQELKSCEDYRCRIYAVVKTMEECNGNKRGTDPH